jgi:hypothetical protein
MRKFVQALCIAALGFAAGASRADTTPPSKEKEPAKTGAKAGGACKADDDCDQSSRPHRCRDGKCEPRPSHPVT